MTFTQQQMEVLEPVEPSARLRVTGRVSGLYDLKRMAMSVFTIEAFNESDNLVTRGEVRLLLLKDGGFGGPRPPRSERVPLPDRAPS